MAEGINPRRGMEVVDSERLAPSAVNGPDCRRADIFWISYHNDNIHPPTPCFCVCTGMIGLTGVVGGCTGIVGLSMRKSEGRAKNEGVGRSEMAQVRRPRRLRPG